MKIFWSWQADTPGRIGRHFVRDALAAAIDALKQPEEIEEPSEREDREALQLDHDRKDVPGSPDLAPTIYRKIEQSSVFVADVTLVAQMQTSAGAREKKLINSNVGIEYGYALHALGDAVILTVQNVHYGARDELPFDLKHKAGPIQFRLAPSATKGEIDQERAKLRASLKAALQLCLEHAARVRRGTPASFQETPTTTSIASFWAPGEVIAQYGSGHDAIDYRFDGAHVFYLRLLPTEPLKDELRLADLAQFVQRRQLQVLTRTYGGAIPGRNRFGAVAVEPHGASSIPTAFTQLFRNGELWAVSSEFAVHHQGSLIVPVGNVQNVYGRVLPIYVAALKEHLGVPPPYQIEMGAVGLRDMRLGYTQGISDVIHQDQVKIRRVLNDLAPAAQEALVKMFVRELFDVAGVPS